MLNMSVDKCVDFCTEKVREGRGGGAGRKHNRLNLHHQKGSHWVNFNPIYYNNYVYPNYKWSYDCLCLCRGDGLARSSPQGQHPLPALPAPHGFVPPSRQQPPPGGGLGRSIAGSCSGPGMLQCILLLGHDAYKQAGERLAVGIAGVFIN